MLDRSLSSGASAGRFREQVRGLCRGLVAALAIAVLAGCEHGSLSYDRSSGTFNLPIGAGSHQGTAR
ncbi:MAG TPA: hypothetical protein VMQ73_04235 [Methylomirabilota bacterium]|nr:hypothetical protein [Methylomirabilota bacterium]